MVEAELLELRKLQPLLNTVQQNQLVHVLFLVEEHPPRGQRSVVGPVVLLGSGVQGADNILAAGGIVVAPRAPPLPLNDRRLFGRGLLLILRVPLKHRHRRLGAVQRREVKKLRPQGLLDRAPVSSLAAEDGGELKHLILVGVSALGHVPNHAPNQVVHVPPGVHDRNLASRHQTGTGTVGKPLVGFLENSEITRQHVLFRVGVIHQQQMRASTGEGGPDTGSEELTALIRVPAPR